MPTLFKTVMRYFYQIRYLKPAQIAARLKQRLVKPRARRDVHIPELRKVPGTWQRPAPLPHHRTATGTFIILGQEKTITLPQGWQDRQLGKKWLMELHAFHLLQNEPARESEQLILNWITHNSSQDGPGWHPYMTSQRICNWLKWSLAGNPLSSEVRASIARQLHYLLQALCYDEMDHKLFNNGKTLLFASYLLESTDSGRWRQEGWALVQRFSGDLLGGDGGYIGLSPMYHCALLYDLLDLANLLEAMAEPVPTYLEESITAARRWLATMCHPDGKISLFNDATFEVVPEPSQLEAYALRLGYPAIVVESESLVHLQDSGFARMARRSAVILADIGNIGPDHAASHGHADTLSFEMSLHGQRLLVDTGLSTYETLPDRLQQRETAAHNTVVLDNRNSSDVWSRFKVGRRARVLDICVWETSGKQHLGAAHDGFRHWGNALQHRREWDLSDCELIVRDKISGHGCHGVDIRFHLHPGINVTALGPCQYALHSADKSIDCVLEFDPHVEASVVEYQYHPGFEQSTSANCLKASYKGPLNQTFNTRLSWQD